VQLESVTRIIKSTGVFHVHGTEKVVLRRRSLEKQPTDLRQNTWYFGDRTLEPGCRGVATEREIAPDHAMRIGPTKRDIAVDDVNQER
jgi:hypothetical protein